MTTKCATEYRTVLKVKDKLTRWMNLDGFIVNTHHKYSIPNPNHSYMTVYISIERHPPV